MYVGGVKSSVVAFTQQYIQSQKWIGSSQYRVSAFQNFLWIENPLNIKKVMSKNVQDHFKLLSTPLTYMALQPL